VAVVTGVIILQVLLVVSIPEVEVEVPEQMVI
jgi:hypothetical protein